MLKRNLLANYLGQGWVALMNFAFVPLYVRLLGVEAYGVIGLFSVLQAWLVLLDMGMTPTLSREVARFSGGEGTTEGIRDLLRSVEIVATLICIAITFVIWLSSHWLATSWLRAGTIPTGELAHAFEVMGFVTALRFFEGIYRGCLLGLQQQVVLNSISAALATVRGLGSVAVLTLISTDLTAFFIWQALSSLLTILSLAFAAYRGFPVARRPGRFSIQALKEVWKFAAGMLGISILSLCLTQVDKILLSRLLPLREYGYYMLASMASSSLYLLVSPITQAWFPRLTKAHASKSFAEFRRLFHQGSQLVAILAGSVAIVGSLFSNLAIVSWIGKPDVALFCSPILSVLLLGNLFNGLMNIPYQAQLAFRWTSLGVQLNAGAVCLAVPAMLWAAPAFGPLGAAWVWLSLNLGYVFIGIHFMFRRILREEKITWFVRDNLVPLSSALIVALIFKYWLLPGSLSLASGVSGVMVCLCSSFVAALIGAADIRKKVFRDGFGLIARKRIADDLGYPSDNRM